MPLRPGMTPEKLNHRSGDNLPGRTIALFRCTQMILWPKHR